MAKTLAADTHVTVGRYDYRNANGLFDDPAQLAKTLKCRAEKSGKKVSVVGYSRGGLLAQRAMGNHDAAKYVEGLVSIATPWHLSLLPRIPADVPVMAVGTRTLSVVPPVQQCPMQGMQTITGDGCFEDWQTANPSGGNVVNRTTLECVHIPIINGCKSHEHQWLKTNRDLVKPVSMQLNEWHKKTEADTSVVKDPGSQGATWRPRSHSRSSFRPPFPPVVIVPPCPDGWTQTSSGETTRMCQPLDCSGGEAGHNGKCQPSIPPVNGPCPNGMVGPGVKTELPVGASSAILPRVVNSSSNGSRRGSNSSRRGNSIGTAATQVNAS